jgi:hypothetical protein
MIRKIGMKMEPTEWKWKTNDGLGPQSVLFKEVAGKGRLWTIRL